MCGKNVTDGKALSTFESIYDLEMVLCEKGVKDISFPQKAKNGYRSQAHLIFLTLSLQFEKQD